MRPVICLITDGRRTSEEEDEGLVARVAAAARAGVHLIQVRERHMEARRLARLVRRCVDAVASTRARVLVNDRLDVALTTGAHGVHLRSDSMPVTAVRAIAPPRFLVGRSVHSAREAGDCAAAGGLDYLIAGTLFSTPSKPGRPAAGVDAIRAVVAATALPVLAVGGVTPDRMEDVRMTGASGFAAIGWFADCPVDAVAARVDAAVRAFEGAARD